MKLAQGTARMSKAAAAREGHQAGRHFHGEEAADERLRQRVLRSLCARGAPENVCLQLEVHGATVVLRGPVRTQDVKWRCDAICRHVPGVRHLDNRLEVASQTVAAGRMSSLPAKSSRPHPLPR